MSSERPRQVPLAVPFGRQMQSRSSLRELLLSAALHLGVLVALVWGGRHLAEVGGRPGEGPGRGGGGGGGGNRMFAVFTAYAAAMPAPPPPPIVMPAQLSMQIPVTRLPEVDQPAAPSVSDLLRQTQGAGPGQGEGSGTGGGPGSGSGTGGGVGSGRGTGVGSDSGGTGRVFPPQPQGIILPPTGAPANLRGVRLTVRFEISERGEVLNVEVDPPIRDRGYRNEFMDRMRRYTFTPAYTVDGRPVRAVFPVLITL
jgi:hypothetical protein